MIRQLRGGFSKTLGKQTLRVRIFREAQGYVCERELVETDGTTFTQALPFVGLSKLRTFFRADEFYSRIETEVEKVLAKLAREVRDEYNIQ